MINVIIINMEYGIHESVTLNHDGSTTIFLNARDSAEQRMRSYRHALGHDDNDDFYKADVQEIEHDAHQ